MDDVLHHVGISAGWYARLFFQETTAVDLNSKKHLINETKLTAGFVLSLPVLEVLRHYGILDDSGQIIQVALLDVGILAQNRKQKAARATLARSTKQIPVNHNVQLPAETTSDVHERCDA